MHCNPDGSYFIDLLDRTIPCDYNLEMISLNDEFDQFASGGVECPDRDLVCMSSGCLDDCSGKGWCHKGKCYCHLGYTGDSSVY